MSNDDMHHHDFLDEHFAGYPTHLSVDQLAEVLGLGSREVAYRRLREGKIPAMNIEGRWLILRDEVKDWARSHYNTTPTNNNDEQ
jgi:excisionase family DNA binding protein